MQREQHYLLSIRISDKKMLSTQCTNLRILQVCNKLFKKDHNFFFSDNFRNEWGWCFIFKMFLWNSLCLSWYHKQNRKVYSLSYSNCLRNFSKYNFYTNFCHKYLVFNVYNRKKNILFMLLLVVKCGATSQFGTVIVCDTPNPPFCVFLSHQKKNSMPQD